MYSLILSLAVLYSAILSILQLFFLHKSINASRGACAKTLVNISIFFTLIIMTLADNGQTYYGAEDSKYIMSKDFGKE